jgi:hypothetical protein
MSDLELWGLIGQIGLVLLVLLVLGWLCRRRPYRDGSQPSTDQRTEPIDEPTSGRTVTTETHAEFIAVPCDFGLDYGRLADALNRQEAPGTDHRDQDDDNPGPSWGIIR